MDSKRDSKRNKNRNALCGCPNITLQRCTLIKARIPETFLQRSLNIFECHLLIDFYKKDPSKEVFQDMCMMVSLKFSAETIVLVICKLFTVISCETFEQKHSPEILVLNFE